MIAVIAATVVAWQIAHRTSPLVRRWNPSSFPRHTAAPLSVLDSGPTGRTDEEVVLLLHGLGATGDYFGAFYDGLSRKRRILIVDLLGFGRSRNEAREVFNIDAHATAIDQALESLALDRSQIVLAAHSMSSAIALTWADRHRDRTRHVYLWGPPIYPHNSAGRSISKEYGTMARLFALNPKWARQACRANCANRDLSSRVMAALAPRWPSPVSMSASRHTWEAYRGSLGALILDFDWTSVLPSSVPVTIFHGTDDPIGDQAHIARRSGSATIVNVPDSGHHLALEHPELLFDALDNL
ncbi:MAG: alpha/beta fold hydrolase [Ilumatobacter sp.]|uniref:alpha/beta fold hydrolase n=1 Tax=Ilumatobacter sp. TaxID=1967498 RepID=UPI00391937F6